VNYEDDKTPICIGDSVTVKTDIYEAADGDAPGGLCANAGDDLVVRHFSHFPYMVYNIFVSHQSRNDGLTFGVNSTELVKQK
jgi:hypothetical protein